MRQKKIKWLTEEFMEENGVVMGVSKLVLPSSKIHLELGSGKGQFITEMAQEHPNDTFIALEKNMSVCFRILEKKQEYALDNLIIILGDANDLLDYVGESEIDYLYLNFSDPWPKPKHHKRRLTAPSFLIMYQHIIKPDAFLQVRTDHASFFTDSVEDIKKKFTITENNKNLPISKYMTEYEEKKRSRGPIYQVIGRNRK